MAGLALAAAMLHGAVAGARSGGSGDAGLRPTGHLRIEKPAEISPELARSIYTKIIDELTGFYAMSREPAAIGYRRWRIYNSAPYLSATHGNRYVNNYGNAKARDYDRMGSGHKMPAGAILAKDSFTVTAEGEVFGAALFVMEKLSPGASPRTADWRYVMILPDGSYVGDSEGDNADEIAYCHSCHKKRRRTDFLFYVPEAYRK